MRDSNFGRLRGELAFYIMSTVWPLQVLLIYTCIYTLNIHIPQNYTFEAVKFDTMMTSPYILNE